MVWRQRTCVAAVCPRTAVSRRETDSWANGHSTQCYDSFSFYTGKHFAKYSKLSAMLDKPNVVVG